MTRKRFLILVLVFAGFGREARAQQTSPVASMQPDCLRLFDFTAQSSGAQATGSVSAGSTGTTSVIDNTQAGCLDWLVAYSTTSTVSGVSLAFQTANNIAGVPGTWGNFPGTLNTGINPNTAVGNGAVTDATGAKYPFLRMNLTSLTGTGRVQGILYGWKRRPTYVSVTSGGGCPGTIGTPCIVAGPDAPDASPTAFPVYIAGKDVNSAVQPIKVDTAGKLLPPTFLYAPIDATADSQLTLDQGTQVPIFYQMFPYLFNGTTWDKSRGDTNGAFVQGVRTNNGAAPVASTQLGVLPAVANAAAPSLTEGRQVLLSMDNSGNLRITGTVVPATDATTANSALTSYTAAAASTNSTSVKGSAGNVYQITSLNTTSTVYYLRMYNSAAGPTCSSATGFVETLAIPNAAGAGAGFSVTNAVPQGYTTGIGFCITGGAGSTDNTNAAVGVFVRILYK